MDAEDLLCQDIRNALQKLRDLASAASVAALNATHPLAKQGARSRQNHKQEAIARLNDLDSEIKRILAALSILPGRDGQDKHNHPLDGRTLPVDYCPACGTWPDEIPWDTQTQPDPTDHLDSLPDL